MKASAFLVHYLYHIKEASWQSMVWPCKDRAVSIKSDAHCHPPCSSARVPEQGTRQGCALLSAGYPHFPLYWRQSNKTGAIPACPSTCFFIQYQIFCPFTTQTFPAAHCHTEQEVKATPQQSGFSRSPFPSLRHSCESHWAAVKMLSIPLSITLSSILDLSFEFCFGAEFSLL